MNFKNWPPVEGRYKVGNKNSPIAICTLASIDEIEVDLNKVAIIGKSVTENIGIEKIIQNVVSNPNIRYLILCGQESKGHFVGQTIEALLKNGIDENKRIIGAKGSLPYLRNLSQEIIERFRRQITSINMIGQTDSKKIGEVVDKFLKTKPEEFKAEAIEIKKIPEIIAKPTNWIQDPNGYFLIFLDKEKREIVVEHYKNGKIQKRIVGENAKEICDTVAKLNLIGRFEQTLEHSMCLGRELQKAELALKENLDYEQDQEVKIKNQKSKRSRLRNIVGTIKKYVRNKISRSKNSGRGLGKGLCFDNERRTR